MKKEIIIMITVLVLIFVPNVLFRNYLKNTGQELIEILKEMNDDITNLEEPDNKLSQKLKDEFLKKEKQWILIVDHDLLDEVEMNVKDSISYYEKNEEASFLASYQKAIDCIEDLYKREELSFANIL